MSSVPGLTVYAINRHVDGQPVTGFDDFVSQPRLDEVSEVRDFESAPGEDPPWAARLYVWEGQPRSPVWLGFIREGFGADLDLPDGAASSALIGVRVFFRTDKFFAVTFGAGRFALRSGAASRGYGLRVALNAIYEGDPDTELLDPAERIRQIESRTVGANTLRTSRQANRAADFDVFELDPEGDQLQGVTGSPASEEGFGKRVRGTDTVRIGRRSEFFELGAICRNIARFHEKTDYRSRLSFVDNFQAERSPALVADLRERAEQALLDDPSDWEFAPPEIIDFDRVASFQVPSLDYESTDVDMEVLLAEVQDPADLSGIAVFALDDHGDVERVWPLLDCVDGQIDDDSGDTFVVDAGEFFRIEENYLDALDAYVSALPAATVALPPSTRVLNAAGEPKEISEGEYNDFAGASDPRWLCLDAQTVRVEARTSAIEVCDLLTLDRHLIHVKRKFASSALSHLFAQGHTSSELFVDNPAYRDAVRTLIQANDPQFLAVVPEEGFVAANYEVVYAIVGDWTGRTVAGLPFFSKINLRKHARQLSRYGYMISVGQVQVVGP